MQPAEVFDLVEGDQEQWNRTCELAAWMVWQIVFAIPSLSKNDHRSEWQQFSRFLELQAPPGYKPEPKPEQASARRRKG